METERRIDVAPRRAASAAAGHGRGSILTTAMVAAAAILGVLALLALELRSNPAAAGLLPAKPRIVVLRRVYVTTVHERIIGGTASGPAVVQHSSVAQAPAAAPAPAPVATRTS